MLFQGIKNSLRELYLDDARPWLVGFSGGKDSTMLASLVFDVVMAIPAEQRKKPISVLCTDTRVEIRFRRHDRRRACPRMRKCSQQHNLNIDANVAPTFRSASGVGRRSARGGLKAGATIEESFWVNIIGRGYPPPNRTFRWCTQRMKIDPVNVFVKQRLGHSL